MSDLNEKREKIKQLLTEHSSHLTTTQVNQRRVIDALADDIVNKHNVSVDGYKKQFNITESDITTLMEPLLESKIVVVRYQAVVPGVKTTELYRMKDIVDIYNTTPGYFTTVYRVI